MKADLHRPICDLLGCEYPVVLAGMGGVARADLVAAVSEAGGFGFLGMVREPVSLIRAETARVRTQTSRDFGVNLIPAATDPGLLDAQVAECIALEVPAVCLFWELSVGIVRRLRQAGIIVICQVGSAEEAREAMMAGAHAVIAQGHEAGGHVRSVVSRDRLLSEVLGAVEIPVLAAGGVASGADLAAILARGADGAVIGTAFLATRESFAHDFHKRRIVEAREGDTVLTGAFHINWPIGAPVRVLKNSVTRGERGDPFTRDRVVIGEEQGRPIYLFSTDSPLQSMTGDFEAMALYASEAAARIADIPPAAERLAAIVDEAAALLNEGSPAMANDEPLEFASPACWAEDADAAYMGYANEDEVTALLTTLLTAKRTTARLLCRIALEADEPALRRKILDQYHCEVDWQRKLTEALRVRNEVPIAAPDEFYRQALTIADVAQRLQFLQDRQNRLSAQCRLMLPKIRDAALHAELSRLLESAAGG